MTPLTFAGCFGWLHAAEGDHGIVLCGAFGHEGLGAHRGWLMLAENLARRGFPVIRFDYHGTGDSAGAESDPHRLKAWTDSIVAAVRALRVATKVERVSLVGLRLGAALAMMASERCDDVAGVACLAPVVSGRTYLRELRLLAAARQDAGLACTLTEGGAGSALDVVGDRIEQETLTELRQMDLLRLEAPRRVLLLEEAPLPENARLAGHLESGGSEVMRLPFPEARDYLQDALSSVVPHHAFEQVADWLGANSRGFSKPSGLCLQPEYPASLTEPGAVEAAICFGEGERLVGVFCRPEVVVPGMPSVLMLNTGLSRHVGDGRLFVTMARQLAKQGLASLRMDVAGTGDSATMPNRPDQALYSVSACADVVAALDWLQQSGAEKAVIVGVCSGAYVGFHGALLDQRICGLFLVNLQKFIWQEGLSFKVENRRTRRPFRYYIGATLQRRAWRKVVRGEVEVLAILMAILRRPLSRWYRALCRLFESLTGFETKAGQVGRWFRQLSDRGVRVSLHYGDVDPGWSELASYFGSHGRELTKFRNVKIDTIVGADHALHQYDARKMVVNKVCEFLREFSPRQTPKAGRLP